MFKKKKQNRKKILNSDLGRKRKTKKRSRKINLKKVFFKFIFYVFLGAFLAGIPYFVFISDFLLIRSVSLSGINRVSQEQVEEDVKALINSQWFQIIPKNNTIFPWEKMLRNEFFPKYPIFKNITVNKKFPDSLEIYFEEREPTIIQNADDLNCVYDSEGELFDRTSELAYLSEENIKIIQLPGNVPFPGCLEKFEKDFLDFILRISQLLREDLDLKIERTWETPNLASGDLRVKTESGWKIFLDKNLGAEKESEMLKLVLESKINEEGRENLEYIDLRTQNRIYYKLKNEKSAESEDSDKDDLAEEKEEKN